MKVVVVGGGWAGCSAAYFAARKGAKVTLVEKTDMLLGTGLVGGIMNNNGRLTAALEATALGLGDIFKVVNTVFRHENIKFPGHNHVSLYDVNKIESVIRNTLVAAGVEIRLKTLINDAVVSDRRITEVGCKVKNDRGKPVSQKITADVFIDTTGTAGPRKNCTKYGTGCARCILRCETYGPRISLTGLAGVKEITAGDTSHSFEAMSGSCKIDKSTLEEALVKKLEKEGVLVIPLPDKFQKKDILETKACQQYALEEFAKNLIILDTGQVKMMSPYFPIESLREIEGFKNAQYADPSTGGKGNSVRFMAISPCDNRLKVDSLKNLFCAGEKIGPIVGHTEAIITGALAGINAVKTLKGQPLAELPSELAIGDIITYMKKEITTADGLKKKFTFSGSVYFERMLKKNLYITDSEEIMKKVRGIGAADMFK